MRKISGLTARSPGLVIIDAQRIFLELKSPARLPDADAVTARILLLTAAFRAQGLPVVFTRHLERPESGRGTSATFFPRPLVADACAARNPQAHDAAIKCLASGHAHTLTTDEVLRFLVDGGRP